MLGELPADLVRIRGEKRAPHLQSIGAAFAPAHPRRIRPRKRGHPMAAYRASAANGRSSRDCNRVLLIQSMSVQLSNPLKSCGRGGGVDDLASASSTEPGSWLPTIIF